MPRLNLNSFKSPRFLVKISRQDQKKTDRSEGLQIRRYWIQKIKKMKLYGDFLRKSKSEDFKVTESNT